MMKFRQLRKLLMASGSSAITKDKKAEAFQTLERKTALYQEQRAVLTRKMFSGNRCNASSGQEGKPGAMLRYIKSKKPTQLMAVLEQDLVAIQYVAAVLAGKEPPKPEVVEA